LKHLLKDGAIVGVSHVVSAATLIGVQVLLARNLSAAEFGGFLLVQACVNLVEAVFIARSGEVALHWIGRTWGLDFGLARGYAKFLEHRELIWNLGVYALLLLAAWPLHLVLDIDPVALAILGLSIPVQSGYGVAKSVFVSAGRLRLQSYFEIAYCHLYLLASIPLTLLFGLNGFIWVTVAAAAVKMVASRWVTHRFWPETVVGAQAVMPPSESLSQHSILRNLCNNFAAQGDVLILGALASKEAVAIYKVARTLANLPIRVAGPVWSVLRPKLLAAMREKDYRRFRRMLVLPGIVIAAIGLGFVPVLWFMAEPILVGLYGETYRGAAIPLSVLFVGTWMFGAVTGWIGFVCVISEHKKVGSMLYMILALFVAAGVFLAGGSVIATAIGVTVAMGLTSIVAWWLLLSSRLLV